MAVKIEKSTIIGDVLDIAPQTAPLFMAIGMHCLGCPSSCGETVEALRGKGVGGRLIVGMANALAAEGWMPVFLCSPERVRFYTRLGFEKMGEYARYEVQ